jgi:hypothetical protein
MITLLWTLFHDRIKPVSSKITSKSTIPGPITVAANKTTAIDCAVLELLAGDTSYPKISAGIDKNLTLLDYQELCTSKGITNQVTTTTIGETSLTNPPNAR